MARASANSAFDGSSLTLSNDTGYNYSYAGEVGQGSERKRVVCLSDTFGKHDRVYIPDGDVFIFAGNFTRRLREPECEEKLLEFNHFLGSLPHKYKVVIAGDQEIALNTMDATNIQSHFTNAMYLQDSAVVVEGLKIYGSPWTPSYGMGFSANFEDLSQHFRKIPRDAHLVVTHCPPLGIRDAARTRCGRMPWGSETLRSRLHKVRPLAHVFGHVRDDHGYAIEDDTLFVNAASEVATVFDVLYDTQHRVRLFTSPSLDIPPAFDQSTTLQNHVQTLTHRRARTASDVPNCRQS